MWVKISAAQRAASRERGHSLTALGAVAGMHIARMLLADKRSLRGCEELSLNRGRPCRMRRGRFLAILRDQQRRAWRDRLTGTEVIEDGGPRGAVLEEGPGVDLGPQCDFTRGRVALTARIT